MRLPFEIVQVFSRDAELFEMEYSTTITLKPLSYLIYWTSWSHLTNLMDTIAFHQSPGDEYHK